MSLSYRTLARTVCAACASIALMGAASAQTAAPAVENDGTVHVPAFDLPFSSFASPEMRQSFVEGKRRLQSVNQHAREEKLTFRAAMDQYYYPPLIEAQKTRYPVKIEVTSVAGVYAEVFTPEQGVSAANKNRVLINLHGGAFFTGGRTGGRVESIPIASVGRIKVISLDYRQFPEHQFPAASEDVEAVYREVLRKTPARNIGIYGCSAGGYLTAQALARFGKNGLPTPGAVGIFGAGAGFGAGTSKYVGTVMQGGPIPPGGPLKAYDMEYLHTGSLTDPLLNPWVSDEVLRKFPPTLILNGLQDLNWSESVVTHNKLTRLGVESQMQLWEGGGHCFLYDPRTPESRDAYDSIVKFFDRHLGR